MLQIFSILSLVLIHSLGSPANFGTRDECTTAANAGGNEITRGSGAKVHNIVLVKVLVAPRSGYLL